MQNSQQKKKTLSLNKSKRSIERTNITNKKVGFNKCQTITDKPLSKMQTIIETYNLRNSTMSPHPSPFLTQEDLKNTQNFNNSITYSLDLLMQISRSTKESLKFQERLKKCFWTKNSERLCSLLFSKTVTKKFRRKIYNKLLPKNKLALFQP